MKAVIMAGGEGSRLRPLTCTVPKPMARIIGKPIIEYILNLLKEHKIDEAAVTLGYLPHIIEEEYENGFGKMKLNFYREDEPLGTAGSVKRAAAGFDEPFVVISGDAMCDFNLTGIMDFHKAQHAAITIVAVSQNDPREYGLLKVDGENRVTGFIEKPSWSQSVTNLANTGVYIINPECLKLIPKDEKFDFAADLFPLMLERGMPIYCYHSDGYWCDVGSIEAYMKCQQDIFDGRMKIYGSDEGRRLIDTEEFSGDDFRIVPPVYIGKSVDISSDAVIGPYAVIDDGASVGANAKIRFSTVLENSWIGENASLTGALICPGAAVRRGAAMFENSVAGAGCVIGENASVSPNISVWPGKTVGRGTSLNFNVKYGNMRSGILSENGVVSGDTIRLSPEICARLGSAVGSTYQGKKTGIAFDSSAKGRTLCYAVASGLLSSGASVWNFGECFEAELQFLVNFCGLGAGIFVCGDEIKICSEGGLTITRSFERSIEAAVRKSEFKETAESEMKEISDMSGMQQLYRQELLKQAPYGLKGIGAYVECSDEKIKNLMEASLKKSGATLASGVTLEIDSDGSRLSAVADGIRYPYEKLLAICCLDEMKNGRDISVPYDAPQFLDGLAAEYGKKVFRYLSSPADSSDSAARRLASRQVFVRDALFLAFRLLSIIKERESFLDELAAEVPDISVFRKKVAIGFSPVDLAKAVGSQEKTDGNCFEGVRLTKGNGKLFVVPERSGEFVNIFAEADSMEAAEELCIDMEELLGREAENNGE